MKTRTKQEHQQSALTEQVYRLLMFSLNCMVAVIKMCSVADSCFPLERRSFTCTTQKWTKTKHQSLKPILCYSALWSVIHVGYETWFPRNSSRCRSSFALVISRSSEAFHCSVTRVARLILIVGFRLRRPLEGSEWCVREDVAAVCVRQRKTILHDS